MVKKMVLFTCILSILFTLSSCGVDRIFRFYTHIQLLWKTENTNGMITNNVLVTEDTVYAGIAGWRKDTKSGLLAIDRKTGKFKWKVPVEL
ncbi:MAG: PQQ-like beta-propeller repeat protein, partial [Thermotogae bacterium]|nr:PQQ-like beta-propeller repeat protein [Thermotogota bacterium]